MAGKRFSIEAIFKATDKLSAPIAKMQTKLAGLSRAAQRAGASANRLADKTFRGVGKMSGALGIGAAAGIAGLGVELKNVIDKGAQFERVLVRAGKAFPDEINRGTAGFTALAAAARVAGRNSEFGALRAAEALNSLATAGFDSRQSIAALPKVLDFATAGQLELADAADMVSDSLGIFGLRSSNAAKNAAGMARVTDVLVRAAADSTTSVTQLFEAMRVGGPVVKQAGASVEQFAAMAGVLANAGIKGSEAGTAIRNAVLIMTSKVPAVTEGFKQLGVTIAKTTTGGVDIASTIDRIASATKGLTQAQRIQSLGAIFGRDSVGPFLSLMAAGGPKIRDMTKGLERAGGAAKSMAESIRADTLGRLERFTSLIEGVRLGVFGAISADVVKLTDSIRGWVEANQALIQSKFASLVAGLREHGPAIVKAAVAFAKLATAIVAVAAVVKTIAGVVSTIEAVKAAAVFLAPLLANPWVLAAVAIAGVVAGIVAFWPEIKAFAVRVGEVATAVAEAVVGLFQTIFPRQVALVKDTVAAVTSIWSGYFDFLTSYWESLGKIFSAVAGVFKSIWGGVFDWLASKLAPIMAIFDKLRGVGRVALGTGERTEREGPQIVSPQERATEALRNELAIGKGQLHITTDQGLKPEVRQQPRGIKLDLAPSGAF